MTKKSFKYPMSATALAPKPRGGVDEGVVRKLYNNLIDGDYGHFEKATYSEEVLEAVAFKVRDFESRELIIQGLIENLPNRNRHYDWNIGSLLQHFDLGAVLAGLRRVGRTEKLMNSIGLAWVLGEFGSRNREVVEYLQSVVRCAADAEAWWRAAFSLEQIGAGQAVNLMKMSLRAGKLEKLERYLDKVEDKKSLIGILLTSTAENIETVVYPRVRQVFLKSNDPTLLINCSWLIGRLKLVDEKILEKLMGLLNHENYEIRYYTFFALQNNATESLRPLLENSLNDTDPLIRKMAARALVSIGSERSLEKIERALNAEHNPSVIAELCRVIYQLRNPKLKEKLMIRLKSTKQENGMINDETDKWYADPRIYNQFSEAEDPENICFGIVANALAGRKISNPIDLATGTGRMLWQIIDKLPFEGALRGVDASQAMCQFLNRIIRRDRRYTHDIKIINSAIKDTPRHLKSKSNLVISSFGFPSCFGRPRRCREELKAVFDLLTNDGVFVTIGWDETFDDELSEMWYRFVPDSIRATDFDDWRRQRCARFRTPRNCDLTWLKRGLNVPLQFSSLAESAQVMGHLFGRDAAEWVIANDKTEWTMSLGITLDTKAGLAAAIDKKPHEYEPRN